MWVMSSWFVQVTRVPARTCEGAGLELEHADRGARHRAALRRARARRPRAPARGSRPLRSTVDVSCDSPFSPASGTGPRSTHLLSTSPRKRADFRPPAALCRTPNSVPKIASSQGALIGCPRSLTPRHFDGGLVLTAPGGGPLRRGGGPCPHSVSSGSWSSRGSPSSRVSPGARSAQRLSLEAGTPVTVYADRVENLDREKLLLAEGNVQIEQGDVRLEADRVEVNTETGEAVATGRVVLFDGRDRLTGERIEYNLRSGTGIVYQARGRRRAALLLRRRPHGAVRRQGLPHRGRGLHDVRGRDPGVVRPPRLGHRLPRRLHVGDQRLVLGLEDPARPLHPVLRDEPAQGPAQRAPRRRPSGAAATRASSSASRSTSCCRTARTSRCRRPTSRSAGSGSARRTATSGTEGSRGELDGFYLHDTEESPDHGQDRWVASLRHEEVITPRLVLKADVARVSDDKFLSEFGNTLDERSAQRLESNLSLTQRWEKWNFFGRLFFYQDLTTDAADRAPAPPRAAAHRLPAARPLGARAPLRDGQLLQQLRARHRLRGPAPRLGAAPVLSLVARRPLHASPRASASARPSTTPEVVGTKVDQGFVVEDTEKEFTARSLFEAGVDLDARAYRVFDLDGAFGIQKLQHVIEPRVSYNFLDGDDSDDLPQWDGIDVITPGNTVTYSLTNRLKARAVGQDDRPGRVWEVIRFTLSQTYTIEPDPISTTVFGTTAPSHHDDAAAAAPSRPGDRADPDHHHDRHAEAALGRRRRPDPRARLRRPLPGDRVLRPLRVHASRPPRPTSPTRRRAGARRSARATATTAGSSSSRARSRPRSAPAGRSGSRATTTSTPAPSSRTGSRSTSASSAGPSPRPSSTGSTRTSSGSRINLLELGQYGFGRGFAGLQ